MTGGRRLLTVLAASQLLISLDHNVVFVALPSLRHALGFAEGNEQWVASAYVLAFGALLIPGGALSDRLGHLNALRVSLAGSFLASALVVVAPTGPLLLVARGCQGACAALLFPATLGVLEAAFEAERPRALAWWSAGGALGGTVGSLLGGLATGWLGWRAAFALPLPLMAGAYLAIGRDVLGPTLRSVPPTRAATAVVPLAVVASTLVLVGSALLTTTGGWIGAPAMAAGVALLAVTGRTCVRDRTVRALLPPGSVIAGVFAFQAGFGGHFYLLTRWLQDRVGLDAQTAGIAFVPLTLAILLGLRIGTLVLRAGAGDAVIAVGFVIGASGMMLAAAADSTALLASGAIGVGQGIVWTALWTHLGERESCAPGLTAAIAASAQQVGGAAGLVALSAATSSVETGGPGVLSTGYLAAALMLTSAALLALVRRVTDLRCPDRLSGGDGHDGPEGFDH